VHRLVAVRDEEYEQVEIARNERQLASVPHQYAAPR